MPLSWNEIKSRAIAFSKEWENTEREEADAKPFLIEFLNVFGITRKRVATFEHKVKKLNDSDGYIDMLWQGFLLIEMKSKGKDLNKAYKQAKEYCQGLKEYELPKLIILSDFHKFQVHDENGKETSFTLPELSKNVHLFSSIAGYEKRTFKEQDPVNIDAALLMGKLHDKLKAIGYEGHPLELYLVRLLFCLFSDDTGIFNKDIFQDYIELRTNEDGSDLAAHLSQLFQVLNTHEEKRLKALDESLNDFPYVNGKLFEETLPVAAFDSDMRKILLECCKLNWGKISPAIFGSLFQSVMDEKARRNLGAHYTSEKNILKVIKPLFLDDLWKEFEACKNDKGKLKKLHDKISKLRFLDPACGCGNFLIIAYRELRRLELEIVKVQLKGQQVTSINDFFLVDVDQFYGIEYEEFPSQIAQVAMWLIDHQMNEEASIFFGDYFKRIPLKKSATIIFGNALRTDWQSLIGKGSVEKGQPKYNFILGNPPFIGKTWQSVSQKLDMELIFKNVNGAGVLDYVTAWYIKAGEYLEQYNNDNDLPKTKIGFVSTNSISQGEQVGIIWSELYNRYKIKIHFAHRTFKWSNEAKSNAGVHVVIIGFSNFDITEKFIYEYDDVKSEPHQLKVKNINPYLVEGSDIFLSKRRKPICSVPEMNYGSMANDGGHLLMDDKEKKDLIKKYPQANEFIRKFVMGDELINNIPRWCLWLEESKPSDFKNMPPLIDRVEAVRKLRLSSSRKATKDLAAFPTRFGEVRQPKSKYIALPRVSSENREYIPMAILSPKIIAGDKVYTIENANFFHFGILLSKMHMDWMRLTAGRLESRYSYSNQITYNNFPWPESPSIKQKGTVEKAVEEVLDVRAKYPESSLADLYDPSTMPPTLTKAHQILNKAVDVCYRPQPFLNETKRIEFLFDLYDKYTSGIFSSISKNKKMK